MKTKLRSQSDQLTNHTRKEETPLIYLDSAATTKIDDEVLNAMLPYMREKFLNAGTAYASDERAAVENARWQVAELFHTTPEHIIFTSGGSEGNSMVFLSRYFRDMGRTSHILSTQIEHDSVYNAARFALHGGIMTLIKPEKDGTISPDAVASCITPNTSLVSVMDANNETGAVNDIRTIGTICREHDVLFHTDCVQSAGHLEIDVDENNIDFATMSAHKIHGPKGVGAMYVRDPSLLFPVVFGSKSQEFGLRGGTENVAGIVGLGKAAEIAVRDAQRDRAKIRGLRETFVFALVKELGGKTDDPLAPKWYEPPTSAGVSIVGDLSRTINKVLCLHINGVDAQTLVLALASQEIYISAGSACHARRSEPSRVLKAMGMSDEEARQCVRISFSKYNTPDEVFEAGEIKCSGLV